MAEEEGGGVEEEPKPKGIASCCFPCQPFACFGGMCFCLPSTWLKIQDMTHFVMVCGVMSCLALVAKNLLVASELKCFNETNFFCAPEIGTVVYAVLLASYVSGIISQWDEQLMAKEEACKEQKAKLLQSYNELLSDMDGLLSNATESASGLAERSFESKRRDFQRFLERAKTRFSAVVNTDSDSEIKMLQQFRKFCLHWLGVFKECSIDPVNKPTEVVTAEELETCVSIVEVADMCLERLRTTEVRFISNQRNEDKKELDSQQKNYKRHTARQGPKMLAITAGGQSGTQNNMDEAGRGSMESLKPKGKIRASWIRCGSVGCGAQCQTYPSNCSAGVIGLTCLSKQHTMLICVFFLGIVIVTQETYRIILELAKQEDDQDLVIRSLSIFFVGVAQWCVTVVLFKFEDIDSVQKLEREVQDLKDQNQSVGEQREKMKDFWNSAQNLTELWLYRTVPRLDLYKELHSQLEDENEEDLLTNITGANNALEMLESSLGKLEAWRNDGALKTDDKKLFGKTVNELCQMGQMGDILNHLTDDVIKGQVMYKLKNLS